MCSELASVKKDLTQTQNKLKLSESQNRRFESVISRKEKDIQNVLTFQVERSGDPTGQLSHALGSSNLISSLLSKVKDVEREKMLLEVGGGGKGRVH